MMYVLAVSLLARDYRDRLSLFLLVWTFCLAGFWITLRVGQVYMPLLLAVVGAWLLLRRGSQVTAGLLIGLLVAIKPTFGLWPLLLLLAGHWRAGSSALVCALAVSLVPLVGSGWGIFQQWIQASLSYPGLGLPGNASLIALTSTFGAAWLGLGLSALLLAGLSTWALRGRPDALQVSRLGLVGALLLGPLSWVGYTTFVLPMYFERRWTCR